MGAKGPEEDKMSELYEIFKDLHMARYVTVPSDNNMICNMISFKLQEGPIKEVGENGCQVDELIGAALIILRSFNKTFPCRENSIAITKLEEALHRLADRTRDREKRGVEGTNQE